MLSINFVFKKHPMSLNAEFDEKALQFDNFEIFSANLENKFFLENCDIIITKGSTMSYEAPINNKPVLLLDLDDGMGIHSNIEMMKNELLMPAFNTVPSLYSFLMKLIDVNSREDLAFKQQTALREKLYYKIGTNSTRFTAEKINDYL